jgi:hypothetical protein
MKPYKGGLKKTVPTKKIKLEHKSDMTCKFRVLQKSGVREPYNYSALSPVIIAYHTLKNPFLGPIKSPRMGSPKWDRRKGARLSLSRS